MHEQVHDPLPLSNVCCCRIPEVSRQLIICRRSYVLKLDRQPLVQRDGSGGRKCRYRYIF